MRKRWHYPNVLALMLMVFCAVACSDDNNNDNNGLPSAIPPPPGSIQAPVSLGSIDSGNNFAVLSATTITNEGDTSITGDIGVWTGTGVTGFGPGVLSGTIYAGVAPADTAQGDLTTAFNDAAGRAADATVAGNLGGRTFVPGVFKSTSSLEISSGNLTLDAQGDSNGVFIFQIASALTVMSGRQVILSGGALAENIFWQVGSSATLGTTSIFAGTIMAQASIALQTRATLNGRALAMDGAVTLESNTVTP